MIETAASDLAGIELVKIPAAARLMGGIKTRDMRQLMARFHKPLIAVSPRRHFIRRADLEAIQAALAKPVNE